MKLHKTKFEQFTASQLKPTGWLKQQLKIQAEGLSGHLDKVWPDIKDSRWIGGTSEGWERVPYWLDGVIPLAFLLDDKDLQKRVKRYVDSIIEKQCDDGWICPCSIEERDDYDIWAAFLICKVLVVYYECTDDARMEAVVYNALYQLKGHIEKNTLHRWSAARWYEALIPIAWLYKRKPEVWMLEMVQLLQALGIDFHKMYQGIDYKRQAHDRYWNQVNHVVNVAMALKANAMVSIFTGEAFEESTKEFYLSIMRNHSMVTGHFTGDECLAGDSPIQGSECCSVVEAMYSYEKLIEIGGDVFWSDLLETVAYNNLPATLSPDMWSHQYVQMTNQISCGLIPDEQIPFVSNSGRAHNFGLEPHFGCCTANFNQGWPKFALSGMMKSENGVAITAYMPCKLNIPIQDTCVTIEQNTLYPFRDTVELVVEAPKEVCFEVLLRIPQFCSAATVNGTQVACGQYHRITKNWVGKTVIQLAFSFETKLVDRPFEKKAVKRGALVFALPIQEEWHKIEYIKNGVERKFPYCDYEIKPRSDWNYGFLEEKFDVSFHDIVDAPFSSKYPPLQMKTNMVKIEWNATNGVCNEESNEENILGEPEEILLNPYGCTNLRMTEMPMAKQVQL